MKLGFRERRIALTADRCREKNDTLSGFTNTFISTGSRERGGWGLGRKIDTAPCGS